MNNDSLLEREKRWLLDEKYAGKETPEYHRDLKRLVSGEPVDYLIGHREFLGCHIDLSCHPLIPRNETEYWTQQLITNHSSPTTGTLRVLDIFAGSGCIGIAVLRHLPHTTVDFIEYNPQFVQQIKKNLALNDIDSSRYHVYKSDMFDSTPQWLDHWDVIVANPPYIAHDRVDTVQESVHSHEDHGSLYADDDGLYFVKKLINELPHRLAPGGSCYIEYDPWQTDLITQYLDNHHPTLSYQITKDQFGKDRVVKIIL